MVLEGKVTSMVELKATATADINVCDRVRWNNDQHQAGSKLSIQGRISMASEAREDQGSMSEETQGDGARSR